MPESPNTGDGELITIAAGESWDWTLVVRSPLKSGVERALASGIVRRRWFASKARRIESLRIVDAIPLTSLAAIVLARVDFESGAGEVYQVPLAVAEGESAERLLAEQAMSVWARVQFAGRPTAGVLYDAVCDEQFCQRLLQLVETDCRTRGNQGELRSSRMPAYERLGGHAGAPIQPRVLLAEQSNSSVIYGDRLVLKLYRRVEQGLNPDLEIISFLTARDFANVPPIAGAIEYQSGNDPCHCLAMLQAYVPNQGDAWQATLQKLTRFVERPPDTDAPDVRGAMCDRSQQPIPEGVATIFCSMLTDAELLGKRTGQLHLALAADDRDPAFAPEALTVPDQRQWIEGISQYAAESFGLLGEHTSRMPEQYVKLAESVLRLEPTLIRRVANLADQPVDVAKIRCHGDYHLGQILVAEDDYYIIDFEGEPARSVDERREKRTALVDVAGMIRSFHYASRTSVANALRSAPSTDVESLDRWSHSWYFWSSAQFLRTYRETVGRASFVPRDGGDFHRLLDTCLLAKAVYELRYELNNRPDWVHLPLSAIRELMDGDDTTS